MSNEYYNFNDPAEPSTIVDAEAYNIQMQAITAAFDIIPSATALSSGTLNYAQGGGVVNAYTATLTGIQQMETGVNVAMKIPITNTGPSTLQINSFPAGTIVMGDGSAPAAGDLKVNGIYTFVDDGVNFQCLQMTTRWFGTAAGDLTKAKASEAAALTSKNNAANSATSAAGSATTSSSKAGTASTQATAATTSATTAATKATAAIASATTAGQKNVAAYNSATAADASEATAATGATNATNSASAAAGSATTASQKATAATGSAQSAAASAATAAGITTDPNFPNRVKAILLDTDVCVGSVHFFASAAAIAAQFPGTTWVRLPPGDTLRIANATGTDVMQTGGASTVTLTASTMPTHNHGVTLGTVSTTDLGTKNLSSVDYGTKNTSSWVSPSFTMSTFDYSTKTMSTYNFAAITSGAAGGHSHTFTIKGDNSDGTAGPKGNNGTGGTGTITTDTEAAHSHSWNVGAHTHTVALGGHAHTFTFADPSHEHTVGVGAHNHTIPIGEHGHSASLTLTNTGSGTAFSVLNSFLTLNAWYRSA